MTNPLFLHRKRAAAVSVRALLRDPWKAWVVFGMACALAFLLLAGSRVAQALIFFAVALGGVVAIAVGVRMHRPNAKKVWQVLLVAQSLYTLALIPWYALPVIFGRTLPYPSGLEPLFWLSYLGWATFLVAAARRAMPHDRSLLLDGLVVAGGAGVASWEFILEPAVAPGSGLAIMASSAVYPVLLGLVAAMAARFGLAAKHREPAHFFLLAWVALELVGDTSYAITSSHGSFSYGSPLFATWLMSYVALGALALHPSMAGLAEPRPARSGRRLPRLLMLAVSAGAPLIVLALHASDISRGERTVMLGAAALLVVLIVIRLGSLIVDLDERQRTHQLLKEHARNLTVMAYNDNLTGLPNRVLFSERLSTHLSEASPRAATAVLLLDVDGFKNLNDTLGHAAGDTLLTEIAQRLAHAATENMTVARLGGDEFAILIPDCPSSEAVEFATKLVDVLGDPYEIAGRAVIGRASIGIVVCRGATDPQVALQRADVAMYAAKARSPGGFEVFAERLHDEVVERYELENDLRLAVPRGELVLHYQPVVNLASGSIIAVEALVRWQHPERGLLPPGRFIPLAEANGSIQAIGRWVLTQAAYDLASFDRLDRGGPRLRLSVNVSPHELRNPHLSDAVAGCLRDAAVDPSRVTLEVTESAFVEDTEELLAQLSRLAAVGVDLAIDDFGTGFSSLSYLRRIPALWLKIDRSFVSGIARNIADLRLAAAIVGLATSVDKKIIAEGVEDAHQADRLMELGCETAQGYLFSRPLPVEQMRALLLRDASVPPTQDRVAAAGAR